MLTKKVTATQTLLHESQQLQGELTSEVKILKMRLADQVHTYYILHLNKHTVTSLYTMLAALWQWLYISAYAFMPQVHSTSQHTSRTCIPQERLQ
jgi:hypothetical protein